MFRPLRNARASSIVADKYGGPANVPGAGISSRPLPDHVAVIGAAGGLGQGFLRVCRAEGIGFTAIVRSRPERIAEVPVGSRVAVVASLADQHALAKAFTGSDAVLTAIGLTPASHDRSALLSRNTATIEASMLAAGVDRIMMINTLLAMPPGRTC
jgi:putative NADH-flavin reductase